jgi:hypothetical protein
LDLLQVVLTKCSQRKNLKEIKNFKNKNFEFLAHALHSSEDVEELSVSPALLSFVFKSCELLGISLPFIL